MTDIDIPASFEVLDVAGSGMACERFLWIRGLSDPTLPRLERIDIIDQIQRSSPGEIMHLASRDGTVAATTFTMRDSTGAGGCYLHVFARADPGEPVLGDLVAFARARATAADAPSVRSIESVDRSHIGALQARHGFIVHERWRRFHLDVNDAPPAARLPGNELPAQLQLSSLAARGDLAPAAFAVYRDGLADAPGDFPRPDEELETWLRDHDSSPVLSREQLLVLHDGSGEVLAMVELELRSARSDRAWVEFLAVARDRRGEGLARLAKQATIDAARTLGIRRLETMNHETNEAICNLNASLGWIEDPVRVALRAEA